MLFELVLLPVVQRPRLRFKPGINPIFGAQVLVNVPRLIDQVEHYLILHRLAEFVGVDVAAKDFQAGLPVFLEQRRASETDEDRLGHHGLHRPVQFAALGAVALGYENQTSPTVWLGWDASSLMNASKSSTFRRPNLWTSEHNRRGLA